MLATHSPDGGTKAQPAVQNSSSDSKTQHIHKGSVLFHIYIYFYSVCISIERMLFILFISSTLKKIENEIFMIKYKENFSKIKN